MFKWVLYITTCIYALTDSYHTFIWLSIGGLEANPLINHLISITTPLVGLFLPKIMFMILLGIIVHKKL